MINLFKPDFGAEEFQLRVDLFCFTDVRLNITPGQSMQLQEQLLRLSDLFTGILHTYLLSSDANRFRHIAVKAKHLSKRFRHIEAVLEKEGIDTEALKLFKRELATEVYSDCVDLDDRDLYKSLNAFLYRQPRHKRSDAGQPEKIG
jgi:hypothetical protein